MKIGIYGGSFDPVHCGHLLVAQAAREELHLDRLYFVPVACSPFKTDQQPAPAAQRLQWLRLALAGRPWCVVDDQEIHRGGTSYTVDLLRSQCELAAQKTMREQQLPRLQHGASDAPEGAQAAACGLTACSFSVALKWPRLTFTVVLIILFCITILQFFPP